MPGNPDIPSDPTPGPTPGVAPLDWTLTAAEAVRRWPASLPLVCLSVPDARGGAGWTIFTSPERTHSGGLALLDTLKHDPTAEQSPLPFMGGWIGVLDYEAGFDAEPTARRTPNTTDLTPTVALLECPNALLHDASSNQWWRVCPAGAGNLPDLSRLRAPSREALMWHCGQLASAQGRDAYIDAVARAVEYTRAGDIFQANIAHQLRAEFDGSARALFTRLLESARPRHGGFIELANGRTVCSISPELFLEADFATGHVRTRPIKGTRPVPLEAELRASDKDAAELVMIVDLMRNDLGRVCRYGSVRVDASRVIERHGPIVHTVATISGQMREKIGLSDLMLAAFPAGSITGAPKVRAMQVIDELEGFRRGAYCGSIGLLSVCGKSTWNVAIRTATIDHGEIVYPVGAGIVEGSDPEMEWEETLLKAEAFTKVLRQGQRRALAVPGVPA